MYEEEMSPLNSDLDGFFYCGPGGAIPPHIPADGFQPMTLAEISQFMMQGRVMAQGIMGAMPPAAPVPAPVGAAAPAVGAPAAVGAVPDSWVAMEKVGNYNRGDVALVKESNEVIGVLNELYAPPSEREHVKVPHPWSRRSKKSSSTQRGAQPIQVDMPRLMPEFGPQMIGLSKRPTVNQVRKALQGKNRGERMTQRQIAMNALAVRPRFPGQTFLEQRAISDSAAIDYMNRYQEFLTYAKRNRYPIKTKNKLDVACCMFLNEKFAEGMDISEATKSFAAIIDARPDCGQKTDLPRTRRALQGWHKLDPGSTRPPLPWHWWLWSVNRC
eukprot:Skav222891  [mRNA]  locus=scaffold1102:216619:220553:- [translate_table: standard]